ncbi:H(+)/Cl(-) exchange transporter ClcA [compost metagenome]
MVAFLTGVTRTPLTAFILVMEMTDRHASIVPLMLSAFTAILVARLLNKEGFYELAVNDYLKTLKENSDEPLARRPE